MARPSDPVAKLGKLKEKKEALETKVSKLQETLKSVNADIKATEKDAKKASK